MEDELLGLVWELDSAKAHILELERKATTIKEQARELGETLEAKRGKVLRHLEEAITDYKVYIRFGKGLERLKIALYKFGYLIALAHFKARYPELKL